MIYFVVFDLLILYSDITVIQCISSRVFQQAVHCPEKAAFPVNSL